VIAGRQDALTGAREAAAALGYRVIVRDAPVQGEARDAALAWYATAMQLAQDIRDPLCVISAGETTVQVTGSGRGGRNQEFALALARAAADEPRDVIVASVGTDGIDGPTDAAGALVDGTTLLRAAHHGLRDPSSYLAQNDSYRFFNTLDDLVRTGRTDTNVGDLQILLAGAPVLPDP
jgi:glycerate 2-kinase